jgi:hypothetical protein
MSEADLEDEGQDPTNAKDLDFETEEDSNHLTNWANEPTIMALKADLEDAKPDHDSHVSQVKKWRAMYNGDTNFPIVPNRSKVVVKTIRKQAEWRYTALSEPFLSADDMFEVEPITWEDKERAEQNALVLNHQMNNRIDKVAFIDEYVRTAVDEGTVIVKVGWKAEKGTITVDKPVWEYLQIQDPEQAQAAMQEEVALHEFMTYEPMEYDKLPPQAKEAHKRFMETGVPWIPVKVGMQRVSEEKFIKNHPTVEVCPYDRITLDPTARGVWDDAQFLVYDFDTTLSALKKDGRYKNLDKINAKNVLEDADDEEGVETTFEFKDKPRQKLRCYEYWGWYDINNDGTTEPFVATWIGDVMIRMEKTPFPDKQLPFIRVKYMPIPNENYGEPDGALLEDNQQIIGAVTRGMIDMMGRSAAGQQGTRKDALDTVNRKRFEKGDDYQFNSTVDPRQAFHMGEFPEIPRSALEMITLQNNEAEAITGVKTFSQGISGAALGSTATAVRGALDAASKRELGILRRLADGVTQIGRKFISMNAEFLDEEEIVRITEDDFVIVRRDDLAGKYDVRLTISTAEADNQKAEEMSFMLQTVGNNLDPALTQIIMADIAKLRQMPSLAKQIEEYQPQPDPYEEEIKKLTIEKLKAEIAELYSKAEENQVDKVKKLAQTEKEKATTRNLNSVSDGMDLDFVEQKEGVTHNRDMDVQEKKNEGALGVSAVGASAKVETEEMKQLNKPKEDEAAGIMKNFSL